MQNGRQIDLSTQVERVKRKTRPWKSIIALLLAIAAAVISHRASHGRSTFFHSSDLTNQFVIYGTAVLFLVFGSSRPTAWPGNRESCSSRRPARRIPPSSGTRS